MSKYLAFTEVVFKDRALLVSALEQVGCTQVIQGENLAMGRYWAEQAETRADIIVPRGVVGKGARARREVPVPTARDLQRASRRSGRGAR